MWGGGGAGERLKRKFRTGRVWVRPTAIEEGGIKPGHYYCLEEEVGEIRQRLLAKGIVPNIALKDEARIKNMSNKKCVICVLPPKVFSYRGAAPEADRSKSGTRSGAPYLSCGARGGADGRSCGAEHKDRWHLDRLGT